MKARQLDGVNILPQIWISNRISSLPKAAKKKPQVIQPGNERSFHCNLPGPQRI